ncbi:MAG: lysylphosphatidylglycerol synthase transmembrane domain-containing protein, partial [Anaerolineales bacterium]
MPGLVISAITLAAVFYIADIGEMLNALRLANYGLVAAAFTLSFAWLAVRAVVWRTLLQDKAAYSPVFFTICEGYLLNNLLPFRMGELARAFLLSQKARLDFWSVLSSIVIERVLDLAIAAGLLLSTLPFVLGATWARTGAVAAAGIVAAGLGVLFLLARHPRQFVDLFMRVTKPWPGIGQALGSRLDAFLSGLSVLNDGWRFLKAVAWVIVNWAVVVLQYYILLRAFFPQARLLWGAF